MNGVEYFVCASFDAAFRNIVHVGCILYLVRETQCIRCIFIWLTFVSYVRRKCKLPKQQKKKHKQTPFAKHTSCENVNCSAIFHRMCAHLRGKCDSPNVIVFLAIAFLQLICWHGIFSRIRLHRAWASWSSVFQSDSIVLRIYFY